MPTNPIFSIIIALGAGLGLYQVYRLAPARQALGRLDAGVGVLLAALAGARAGYVLLNGFSYAARPLEALNITLGGLSWQGAVVGALLALPLAARLSRTPFLELADSLAHLLPPLAAAAWLGCWTAGCACAPAASGQPWWALPAPDETGLAAPRFPLQPAAALLLAFEMLLAHSLSGSRARPGLLAARFTLALALNLLLFSFLTVETRPPWHGLRVSTWSAALLTVLSLGGLALLRLKLPLTQTQDLARQPGER